MYEPLRTVYNTYSNGSPILLWEDFLRFLQVEQNVTNHNSLQNSKNKF